MWETIKKYWTFIVAGIGTLVGLFFWKKSRDAKAELDHATNTTDNAVTTAKVEILDKELQRERERIEKEKGRKLTDKELEDFLKRL